MAEDRDGNMWFGLEKGVVRYDGVNWTPSDSEAWLGARVWALYVARDGTLYAGSEYGLSLFRDDNWERVWPASRG